MHKPRQFRTFEELPEKLQDRQEVIKWQRTYAEAFSINANALAAEVTRQAFTSMEADKQMYFCWTEKVEQLVMYYRMLCEHSEALVLIEQELSDIHESQKDSLPF